MFARQFAQSIFSFLQITGRACVMLCRLRDVYAPDSLLLDGSGSSILKPFLDHLDHGGACFVRYWDKRGHTLAPESGAVTYAVAA
jgi:hypothetical protein